MYDSDHLLKFGAQFLVQVSRFVEGGLQQPVPLGLLRQRVLQTLGGDSIGFKNHPNNVNC